MNRDAILKLLRNVQNGGLTPEEAIGHLKLSPFEDLGYAKVDHHRSIRHGVGEVIFGQNKTPQQIEGIVTSLVNGGAQDILITRISPQIVSELERKFELDYNDIARIAVVARDKTKILRGMVAVVSAGTSDMSVAEEAALTAETLGSRVIRIYDAGVAGIHRLLYHMEELTAARAIVAVAGMEGALPSVVGGLVSCPVIAVPTSVGYGASFGGVAALLAMLNSCASGVSVVNIDNGFGAGYIAHQTNMMEGLT